MGLRINTNVASLAAQNALRKTSKKLNVALQRLSTGLKINTGSDDIVGLAKSESLRAQIRGIGQAQSNINNVSAVLGVAEGYTQQLTEILQSMRETAVQSADGTLSSSDRSSLTNKFTDLMNEYNRLSNSANFNGVKLLDGSFLNKTIQIGTNQGETLTVSLADARSSSIGKVAILTTAAITAQAASNGSLAFADPSGITIGSTSLSASSFTSDGTSYLEADESALAYVSAINSISSSTGVIATALSNIFTISYSAGNKLSAGATMTLNGVTIHSSTDGTLAISNDTTASSLVDRINAVATQTGVTAAVDTSANTITLTASDGRNINIVNTASNGKVFGITTSSTNFAFLQRGRYKLTSASAFSLSGHTAEFGSSTTTVSLDSSTVLSSASLASASSSGDAISILDNAISQMQSRRATIGSTINRFDVAYEEMSSRTENLNSADSRIRDADIAEETAKLTQFQILQQAGVTVLGQANSAPQIALTLLQNL